MDRHSTDNIALIFGLMFTTVAAVTLAGLSDVAEIDGGVAFGSAMVLAAIGVGVVTVTNLQESRSPAVAGPQSAVIDDATDAFSLADDAAEIDPDDTDAVDADAVETGETETDAVDIDADGTDVWTAAADPDEDE